MERRKKESAQALARTAPNAEESRLIHDMFLKWEKNPTLGATGKNEKLMSDAMYSDISICHPAVSPPNSYLFETSKKNADYFFSFAFQHRNRYNKIFGGYVMRMAYELAWASATSFT